MYRFVEPHHLLINDRLRRNISIRNNRGVYTVEMAIVIPLLLVLIFAVIDLCQVTAQRSMLLSAMHSAGRAAALANNTLAAYDIAVENFEDYREGNLVLGRIISNNEDEPETEPILIPNTKSIIVGNSCMCGLTLELKASVSCEFFCRPIAGIGQMMGNNGRQPLILQGFYPYEDQNLCAGYC